MSDPHAGRGIVPQGYVDHCGSLAGAGRSLLFPSGPAGRTHCSVGSRRQLVLVSPWSPVVKPEPCRPAVWLASRRGVAQSVATARRSASRTAWSSHLRASWRRTPCWRARRGDQQRDLAGGGIDHQLADPPGPSPPSRFAPPHRPSPLPRLGDVVVGAGLSKQPGVEQTTRCEKLDPKWTRRSSDARC
jgi:hypothetical protein